MEDIDKDINKNKKRIWLFINAIFFIVLAAVSVVAYKVITNGELAVFSDFSGSQPEEKARPELARRLLDGVYVPAGEENFPPLAIMIDNHTDARPPAGLSQAGLVIEAEAEGGITRYLAVFTGANEIAKIGPVRSARPYFVDWAKELSALYVHVGGSPEALARMTKENVFHINEFYNELNFWRDQERLAPHNVFTSNSLLYEYLDKKQVQEGKFLPWAYKEDAGYEERGEGQKIDIDNSLRDYAVNWTYNRDENNYARKVGGYEYKDANGEQIKAKNIIIQTASAVETDNELRLDMEIIGEGKAEICRDGNCVSGSWRKDSSSARTRFYTEDGAEAYFNAGTSWVEVIRPSIVVTVK